MLLREVCSMARLRNPDLIRGAFPPRGDGSRGWLCAYAAPQGMRKWFSGCNAYYLDGSKFRYFWSQSLFSEELNQLLKRLESVVPSVYPPFFSKDDLAECIRCNLAIHQEGRIRWYTPVLNGKQAEELQALFQQMSLSLLESVEPIANALHELMKAELPSHLHSQIRGIFGIEFNSLIDMVCSELLQLSVLQNPESDIFAGQVIMLSPNIPAFKL